MNHKQLRQLMDDYVIEDGVIMNPGKFGGEPRWAPYLWQYSETVDIPNPDFPHLVVSRTKIIEDDVAIFPELSGVEYADFVEDDWGFVYAIPKYKVE